MGQHASHMKVTPWELGNRAAAAEGQSKRPRETRRPVRPCFRRGHTFGGRTLSSAKLDGQDPCMPKESRPPPLIASDRPVRSGVTGSRAGARRVPSVQTRQCRVQQPAQPQHVRRHGRHQRGGAPPAAGPPRPPPTTGRPADHPRTPAARRRPGRRPGAPPARPDRPSRPARRARRPAPGHARCREADRHDAAARPRRRPAPARPRRAHGTPARPAHASHPAAAHRAPAPGAARTPAPSATSRSSTRTHTREPRRGRYAMTSRRVCGTGSRRTQAELGPRGGGGAVRRGGTQAPRHGSGGVLPAMPEDRGTREGRTDVP
jgi:hypothetical protein